MKALRMTALTCCTAFAALLSACGERVSVGVWDVEIESTQGREAAVWTISDPAAITMQGSGPLTLSAEAVDLVGSRIHWAGTMSPAPVDGERVTFTGTVNGNSFSGTLYTTAGNWTVRGARR